MKCADAARRCPTSQPRLTKMVVEGKRRGRGREFHPRRDAGWEVGRLDGAGEGAQTVFEIDQGRNERVGRPPQHGTASPDAREFMSNRNDNSKAGTALGPAANDEAPTTRNRARGAQPGNRNARKHGIHAADAGRIDLRRREDRAVFDTLAAIEADLGGGGEISAQRALILAGVGRKLRDLSKIESYLDGLSSIINKRRRDLLPIVVRKHQLLESIRRDLESIGLERRTEEAPDLGAYLESRSQRSGATNGSGEGAGQGPGENAQRGAPEAHGDA